MPLRGVLINVALFALSTVFAVGLVFGIGEIVLRIRAGPDAGVTSWLVSHPDRGWALAPGDYVQIDHNDLRKTRVSINELGLRQPPLPLRVPDGRRRWSILGDSFVFGAALEESQTIPGHLRALAGDAIEVVNLGVEGYGTGHEILLLEDLVARGYQPGEAIVLVFFPNDLLDNLGLEYGTGTPVPHMTRFWVDSTGALRHTRPAVRASHWGRALERRWMFFRYLRSRATNLVMANAWLLDAAGMFGLRPDLPRTPAVVEGFYSPGWQERWRETERILEVMKRLAGERLGSRLYVAFVPSPFQVVETLEKMARRRAAADPFFAAFLEDPDRPQRCLREYCERSGVPFIDATPPLRAARSRPTYLVEAHLSPYGAGIVAAALLDAIGRDTPK